MHYITINLLAGSVEQVRDTWEEAQKAAEGDDCLVAWPVPFAEWVRPGHRVKIEIRPLVRWR